jgi:hypothetical protein
VLKDVQETPAVKEIKNAVPMAVDGLVYLQVRSLKNI